MRWQDVTVRLRRLAVISQIPDDTTDLLHADRRLCLLLISGVHAYWI